MTDLAPHLSTYLKVHLPSERNFSPHTLESYTESFRLLVVYASERLGIRPCKLTVEHLTVALLTAFLGHLETVRKNGVGTRNVRLAAIKSFFRYLECRVPACLDLALQVRAIPMKIADRPLVDWLGQFEIQAILDAPDPATLAGLRDRAMLHLCYAAGLRVSELITLTLDSLSGPGLENVRIMGKGRRERELPLWKETRTVLDHWLAVRPAVRSRHLFLNARGAGMSTDGFSYILKRHVAVAARAVPSIRDKRVTPHVLRHSAAMAVLHATRDIRKVSLWLGHATLASTEMYLHASPAEKLDILQATVPPSIRPGRFPGVRDSLMELLNGK